MAKFNNPVGCKISYRGQAANWLKLPGITSREVKRDVSKPMYEGMAKSELKA